VPTPATTQERPAAPGEIVNPTEAIAERLKDPSKWFVLRNVPIFDEHDEEVDSDEPEIDPVTGKPLIDPATKKPRMKKRVERFDVPTLERHAAHCNEFVASGKPPGLTDGHTKDDAPEGSQPETWGFGQNFRVGWNQRLNRNVIYQDEYYFPERAEDVRSRPYRSVERWKGGQYFAPIALLRREPRRNLGIVTYHHRGADTVVRYSMETYAMPETAMPPEAGAAPPPTAAPQVDPSDTDKQVFAKLYKYFTDPANKAECEKYGISMAGGVPGATETPGGKPKSPEAAPEQFGMGMPSGSNVAPPGGTQYGKAGGEAAWDANQDDPDARAAMAAAASGRPNPHPHAMPTHDLVRYQAELAQRDAKIAQQGERLAALEKSERVERYSAALADLERVRVFDRPKVLGRVQDYTPAQFAAVCEDIRENYQRRPGNTPIRLADLDSPMSPGGEMSREVMEKALQYQAENPGVGVWDAVEKVGGKRPGVVRGA
jgi:hypothetical protein